MRRAFVLLACLLSSAAALRSTLSSIDRRASATQVARAVDPTVLRAHLEFLADDALEGRGPGTRGGELAAKYIAAQFERLGPRAGGRQRHLLPARSHHRAHARAHPLQSPAPTPGDLTLPEGLRALVDAERFAGDSSRAIWCSWATASSRRSIDWNDYAGRRREGQDRGRPGQRPRAAGLDHLPRARSSPTTAAGPTRSRRPSGRAPPAS